MQTSIKTVDEHLKRIIPRYHWVDKKARNLIILFHDTNWMEYSLIFPMKCVSLEVYYCWHFLTSDINIQSSISLSNQTEIFNLRNYQLKYFLHCQSMFCLFKCYLFPLQNQNNKNHYFGYKLIPFLVKVVLCPANLMLQR